MRTRRIFGTLFIVAGLALCSAAGLHYLRGDLAQSQARTDFERRISRSLSATPALPAQVTTPAPPLAQVTTTPAENPGIVSTAETPTPSPAYPYGEPVARIRIPVAQIDWIVLEGSDKATLEKGPGHVPGTALPGTDGPPNNCVITGHRDSHFRHLGWLKKGHLIELDTPSGRRIYRIVDRQIVKPDAVSVLAPTPEPRLTLITCYPFTYIGPAPQRLVLIAEPVGSASTRHRS